MFITFHAPSGARLRQLLVLLLLALALLAGVSLSQTRQAEDSVQHTAAAALPALRQVHALTALLDELRGMSALHLTLAGESERQALEGRLQAARLLMDRRLAALARHAAGPADRPHHRQVAAGLASFWEAQDRLLAASRLAGSDPAAAETARRLLAGESQQAYTRLRADILAWAAHAEQAADSATDQARSAMHLATQLVWAQAALVVLALAVAWALLRTPRRLLLPPAAGAAALQSAAAQAHLDALNAAVAAARCAEPGRAAGLSAAQARQLAEQVDGAARGLRRLVGRPQRAAQSAVDDAQD